MNKLEILKDGIKDVLLGNDTVLWQTVGEINSYNSSLDNLEYQENDEEFFNTYFYNDPMGAIRATQYGEYNYTDEFVKFNGYGNLDSASESYVTEEMQDSINEIIDQVIENYSNLDLDSDIMDLIEEYEEDEESEEN